MIPQPPRQHPCSLGLTELFQRRPHAGPAAREMAARALLGLEQGETASGGPGPRGGGVVSGTEQSGAQSDTKQKRRRARYHLVALAVYPR